VAADKTEWADVPAYLLGQMVGAFLGAVLAWAAYKLQFDTHDEPQNTRGIFSTGPTVPNYTWNVITEVIGTFVLVFWILLSPGVTAGPDGVPVFGNGALGYAAVAFVVVSIGASLGGPTGYAINPARDLGPRIAYAVLPIKGKGSPDWNYSWVPVAGPIVGGVLAGLLYQILPTS
jgi:glycerol uptake facilitator protein